MSNEQGCTCNAWSENECACGADWTPQEVYDLRAENERLKTELKSIDAALDDPRVNITLTTAEVVLELKAELAEAKKDAGRYIAKRKLDFTRSKAVNEIIYNTSYDRTVDYVIDEAMKGK